MRTTAVDLILPNMPRPGTNGLGIGGESQPAPPASQSGRQCRNQPTVLPHLIESLWLRVIFNKSFVGNALAPRGARFLVDSVVSNEPRSNHSWLFIKSFDHGSNEVPGIPVHILLLGAVGYCITSLLVVSSGVKQRYHVISVSCLHVFFRSDSSD